MYINIVLSIILLIGIAYAIRVVWVNYQQKKLQDALVEELKIIIDKYAQRINEPKKKPALFEGGSSYDLTDPLVLASLITVMVNKNGIPIRLSLADFANVQENDYVRVYIDMETNDLILSTGDADISDSIWLFGSKDDDPIYN
jgi:hypothetical protein